MTEPRYAACPFFLHKSRMDKRQMTITHENPEFNIGFIVHNQIRFDTWADRDDFYELFCCEMYLNCPYYRMLDEKYERREKHEQEKKKRTADAAKEGKHRNA